ncbi:hypothetical protein CYMTET_51176 [Cymbomonas tetramitiformis]|uniref:riboflavin kinase n=1 Tax=Cymbomonas tetramitiformis TaxID=36881 RepID=A0AAE0BLT2_9CHLO|nr:hypothetical protein CYMTET_51176 [Cymbomonas tetramitiformis]
MHFYTPYPNLLYSTPRSLPSRRTASAFSSLPFQTRPAANLERSRLRGRARLSQATCVACASNASGAQGAVAAANLAEGSRVMDVSFAGNTLSSALQEVGVHDILLVQGAASEADQNDDTPVLGNTACVRVLCRDVSELPRYYGPFDAIFFNETCGKLPSAREAINNALQLLKPGGKIIVTVEDSAAQEELRQLTADTPLRALEMEAGACCMVLELPLLYAVGGSPRYMGGEVVVGFGRGSKQMGVPTANIDPQAIAAELEGLAKGVYFGWAQLEGDAGPAHKMVMNIGDRPTFVDGEGISVEVNIMNEYGRDFHGEQLRVIIVGHLRPEMRFPSMGALVEQIHVDIGKARSTLDDPTWQQLRSEPFLTEFQS